MEFVWRTLYTLALYMAIPFALIRLWWRGLRLPAYRQRITERFGFITPPYRGGIWIHAVSVGEWHAALPLVTALQQYNPMLPIFITTTTGTASLQVQRMLQDALSPALQHSYAPYDLPSCIHRFIKRLRPHLVLILETELWPNWIAACQRSAIPVFLINGRLSARSASRYARIPGLIRPLLQRLTGIAAQTDADAQRFRVLGATHVWVMGLLKYDLAVAADIYERGKLLRKNWIGKAIWIAASTHTDEEELVLIALRIIRKKCPDTKLILVPRHPERAVFVTHRCQQHGWIVHRGRSDPLPPAATDVWVVESVGELLWFYAAAAVAFVGGSLIPRGGHNPLEPAALGLPILTGPYIHHFLHPYQQLIEADAARIVHTAEELAQGVAHWLGDEKARQQAGERGRRVVERHRGVTLRLIEKLSPWLDSRRT